MKKQLYIKFVQAKTTSIMELYEEQAPKTVFSLWNALNKPIQVSSMHAMFAGPEIMIDIPHEARNFDPASIPNENQTCFPKAGDCLWYYQKANSMKGLNFEMWEVGMFYGDNGRTFGPLGWTPVNIFGSICENLAGFAQECAMMRTNGSKLIEIGRYA